MNIMATQALIGVRHLRFRLFLYTDSEVTQSASRSPDQLNVTRSGIRRSPRKALLLQLRWIRETGHRLWPNDWKVGNGWLSG
jgi:hypothetical protein